MSKRIRFLPGYKATPGKRLTWKVKASIWLTFVTLPIVTMKYQRFTGSDRAETDPVLLAHMDAVNDLFVAASVLAEQAGESLEDVIKLCREVLDEKDTIVPRGRQQK